MQTLCGHVDKPLARLAHIPTQPYYQALLSMLVSTRNDEGPIKRTRKRKFLDALELGDYWAKSMSLMGPEAS